MSDKAENFAKIRNADEYRFSEDDVKCLSLPLPDCPNALRLAGDFDGEEKAILDILKRKVDIPLTKDLKTRLGLELIIVRGMKRDYLTDEETLFSALKNIYPMLTREDFSKILQSGHVDFIYRKGRKYYQNSALSNILYTQGAFLDSLARGDGIIIPYRNALRHENAEVMEKQGYRSLRYTVSHKITLDEKFADLKGKKLRIYFPFPCECEEQSDIKLIYSSHGVKISSAAQRTAVMDVIYDPDAVYEVKYSFVNRAPYRKVDPDSVYDDGYRGYLGEEYPHIRFTPLLRSLAEEISQGEQNPYLRAKAVYKWITENVKYSYMREYFYIDNIPEFAVMNRRGDCGVQALLFITLCRILGVPAAWQSGLHVCPDSVGSHDWAKFYVAPYGWLYADASFGGAALRNRDMVLYEHFFGNIDPNRMVSCTQFMGKFDPPKKFIRCDPFDNQSGEAEFEEFPVLHGELHAKRSVLSAEEVL